MPLKKKSFTIKDWDVSDRPREKLKSQGASYLSNAELFAVLIGSGSSSESAVGLMKRILLSINNDLQKFDQLPIERLVEFKGIGEVKAIKLKAVVELSKRFQKQQPDKTTVLNSSKIVYESIYMDLDTLPHEEFWILYLNQSNRLLEKYRLSKGGITQTTVDLRLAFKRAFEVGATGLILAHNHPSGGLTPSSSDEQITRKFKLAAASVDLRILDHLIVSKKGYFSFADEGLL
ncbi:DNA repair protein RadC [Flavobacteriaceae bacterium]|jgi:DNA repair protein RadC|nr:DNA repair protein RadC [Flavobacteriaceae bacterium]MBT5282629.1 DNA repair protein RadC [Flavobacteriaceae bacterium]MBT5447219.1 DNA repair protein RadC [Flavobacteriaceae bacterium]MBT7675452.1 DNA repair protein RadC [Flavobacteriaceae bacterium]MDB4128814.1 DNA repair protein RadC [Flavobacteriaceae bacterium]|tara:strand:- start:13003 stop:13701 length:699 start_codon:yes stop_codon:yes gene_type:complete